VSSYLIGEKHLLVELRLSYLWNDSRVSLGKLYGSVRCYYVPPCSKWQEENYRK